MTKKALPSDIIMQWNRVRSALEADYLDALTDEEFEEELDREFTIMSELEQRRAVKSADQLQRNIQAIFEAEKAKLRVNSQQGLRAAADDLGFDDDNKRDLGYVPLPRKIIVGESMFQLGVATMRPREVVLIGPLPENAVALRIGTRRIALDATNDCNVHRCRDLGEPQLKSLLDVAHPPGIEIVIGDKIW